MLIKISRQAWLSFAYLRVNTIKESFFGLRFVFAILLYHLYDGSILLFDQIHCSFFKTVVSEGQLHILIKFIFLSTYHQRPINENVITHEIKKSPLIKGFFLLFHIFQTCVICHFVNNPSTKIYAQYGIYLLILTTAFSSANLIYPSSTAALITRDTIALFFSSTPSRFLNSLLDTSMSLI